MALKEFYLLEEKKIGTMQPEHKVDYHQLKEALILNETS